MTLREEAEAPLSPPRRLMRLAHGTQGTIERAVTRFDSDRQVRVLELTVTWPGITGYDENPDDEDDTEPCESCADVLDAETCKRDADGCALCDECWADLTGERAFDFGGSPSQEVRGGE